MEQYKTFEQVYRNVPTIKHEIRKMMKAKSSHDYFTHQDLAMTCLWTLADTGIINGFVCISFCDVSWKMYQKRFGN